MRPFFYSANFCAECGNEVERRLGWRNRYFCDYCRHVLARNRTGKSLLWIFLIFIAVASTFNEKHVAEKTRTIKTVKPIKVTYEEKNISNTVEYCGARTKKGTPCKRRVSPGQRCYQHKGKPSILDKSSGVQ